MVVERGQNPSQWSGWRGNLEEESVAGTNGGGQEWAAEREPDNKTQTPEEACWLHDWTEQG